MPGDLRNLELALNASGIAEALVLLAKSFFPSPARGEDRAWRRLAVQLWAESLDDATVLKRFETALTGRDCCWRLSCAGQRGAGNWNGAWNRRHGLGF